MIFNLFFWVFIGVCGYITIDALTGIWNIHQRSKRRKLKNLIKKSIAEYFEELEEA